MNIKILISSYVSSTFREECIRELFKSIYHSIKFLNNSRIYIEIIVSYSGLNLDEKDVYIEMSELYGEEFKTDLHKHLTRAYQFSGYLYLSKNTFVDDNDIIIFSDDDDLFPPNKIKDIVDAFSGNSDGMIESIIPYDIVHFDIYMFGDMCVENIITYNQMIELSNAHTLHKNHQPEYFAFAMKGYIFKKEIQHYTELSEGTTEEKVLPFYDLVFLNHTQQLFSKLRFLNEEKEIYANSYYIPKCLVWYRRQPYQKDMYVKN